MTRIGKQREAIGVRGEAIFTTVLTRFHGQLPLFRVHFLGDKWPLVDFLVELEGSWKQRRPFFLVQVKTSTRGYTVNKGRLKMSIKQADVVGLRGYRVPVYVGGVDMNREEVYLAAAMGSKVGGLSSLGTAGRLDHDARKALWTEVRDHWRTVPFPAYQSRFQEPHWRK